jgi:hypothetical protein
MISIDTVYQRVLAIANKEQRGYITPQEFNLMANQAQLDMFEQYFYDMGVRDEADDGFSDFGNMADLLQDKIRIFTSIENMAYTSPKWDVPALTTEGHDVYRHGEIYIKNHTPRTIDPEEVNRINRSMYNGMDALGDSVEYVMFKFSTGYRFYTLPGSEIVTASPQPTVECVRKPKKVRWGYIVVNEQALYNASASVDFELHPADETDLVIKILELAGMVINKPQLAAFAGQEEGANAADESK